MGPRSVGDQMSVLNGYQKTWLRGDVVAGVAGGGHRDPGEPRVRQDRRATDPDRAVLRPAAGADVRPDRVVAAVGGGGGFGDSGAGRGWSGPGRGSGDRAVRVRGGGAVHHDRGVPAAVRGREAGVPRRPDLPTGPGRVPVRGRGLADHRQPVGDARSAGQRQHLGQAAPHPGRTSTRPTGPPPPWRSAPSSSCSHSRRRCPRSPPHWCR